MQPARVLGQAISTLKHASLTGQRLLVVQPMLADGKSPDAFPLIVVDRFGAGRGDTVLITSDASTIRRELGDQTPVRWSTIGIQDPK